MKINILLLTVVSLFVLSCIQPQNCLDGINLLPMYGEVKKCPGQLEADQQFLKECDKDYKTRKEAAAHMVMRGWQYFYSNKPDTSMMRFNQAYLLDSLNAEIYWGYGNLLGMQKKFKESLRFFKRSLKLHANNAKIWQDMAISYGNLFFDSKDSKFLDSAVSSTKKAITLDPNNPKLYGQLTTCYSYFIQKDSAKKYLKITEQMNPNAVNPEVKQLLSDK